MTINHEFANIVFLELIKENQYLIVFFIYEYLIMITYLNMKIKKIFLPRKIILIFLNLHFFNLRYKVSALMMKK